MTTASQPAAHLHGRWLIVGRVLWFALLLLQLVVMIAGVAVWFPALQQMCVQACSHWWQLTPANAHALQSLGWSLVDYAWYVLLIRVLPAIISLGVGAFIFWHKPNDRMVFTVTLYLIVGVDTTLGSALSAAQPTWWLLTQGLSLIGTFCFALFFYLFPSGYFVPRWTRWTALAMGVAFFINTFFHGSRFDYTQWEGLSGLAFGLVFASSLVLAQIYRYFWVSSPVERAQTRWVVSTAILTLTMSLSFNWLTNTITLAWFLREAGTAVALSLIPVTLAIAILHYRLFDIDIIIRRTLQYSLLSGLLALVYFSLVVLLQNIFFRNQPSPIIVVLSTLAIAALFLPLRRRVQDFIDKRFYRKKYDAAKVIADFAATCRDETDLDQLTTRLVETVQDTMQPESVQLWLRPDAPRQKS